MDTKIILVISAALFILIVLVFLFKYLMLYQKKTLAFMDEREVIRAQFQEAILKTQLEIKEQTFKTISQEIHDNIGQILSLAKLNLNTLDLSNREETLEKITEARTQVSRAILDLRDLSRSLNTDTIQSIGLCRAIETELQLIQKTGELRVLMELTGTVQRLEPEKELILFRMVQESLHNIIKHAKATVLIVQLDFQEKLLILRIRDDGQGFDIQTSGAGSGLRNMKSRSLLIGAELHIFSTADEGTNIQIHLPINS